MAPASYGAALRVLAATLALAATGCAGERPTLPSSVTVGSGAATIRPVEPAAAGAAPHIVAARFSSLDVALGERWTGDIVTSTDAIAVDLRTNLFDIVARRVARGRFHFDVRVYDLPAFLVRPYALHVVARAASGRETTLMVPFRIAGRDLSKG